MQLTSEELDRLDHDGSVPVVVEGRECVLVRSDVFETREQALIEDWHPETMQLHLADMIADDWNEPAMSVYGGETRGSIR